MGTDTAVATASGEDELVARARDGDPDAWEQLYRQVYPRLFAYARRRLGTTEQAEEAVSETIVRAMHGIDRYRSTATGIEAWLFGIARNVLLEAYRASRRRSLVPRHADLDRATHGVDPELAVLVSEERRLVARAFARLSDDDQALLELRVLGGLDARQVGEITGRRPGAVRMAQSRALGRLRIELGLEGRSA